MPPPLISLSRPHSQRLVKTLLTAASQYAPFLARKLSGNSQGAPHTLVKRSEKAEGTNLIVYACLIPVLVLLSGLFAGLTLGYMSLDETQLHVLSVSGTPEQQKYAKKIIPIRKNGHLLLVSLLLVNMIVNESLPIIADPVLGGGIQAVVVSTVLIIIFAEIIPQSLFTRNGLRLGAKMAGVTRVLIYAVGIVSWPIAKLLEWSLGPHHGIMYRRTELKELISMHSNKATLGGDLKLDTVNIVRSTLDLQEKVVTEAMTPIDKVFMLSLETCKLDYATLKEIVATGHSRIPVYEEVDVPHGYEGDFDVAEKTPKVKRIVGILLVKQCVLLDPKDEVPLRDIPLNRVPFVPSNESLLGILDKFQQGRSHMAIVSRFAVTQEKAESVKKATKKGLTQRFKARVGMADSSDEEDEDLESGGGKNKSKRISMHKTPTTLSFMSSSGLEQAMPADAVLANEGAEDYLRVFDQRIMPVGIITLEDVLEELIGEEIYDEYDTEGDGTVVTYESERQLQPAAPVPPEPVLAAPAPALQRNHTAGLRGFINARSRSVPPTSRGPTPVTMIKEKDNSLSVERPKEAEKTTVVEKEKIALDVLEVGDRAGQPLGAVLFERKKSKSKGGAISPRSGTPAAKGAMFKSTPLSDDGKV